MFNKMPTAVEVGADRPIIVRLAVGWILIIYAMGETHQQSLHQPLYHDPERFVVAIEVAYHAEQDGSGDGLGRKAHEVGVAVGNNSGICRMDVDAAGNTVAYMVPNYQIDGKTGTWLPYDSEVVEGVCFFMMRNEQRKDAVSPVVVDSKGVFVTDARKGLKISPTP